MQNLNNNKKKPPHRIYCIILFKHFDQIFLMCYMTLVSNDFNAKCDVSVKTDGLPGN